LGEDVRASKFEGILKADAGTGQAPLKPSLRHGAARAAEARRSESSDRASMKSCTGNERKTQVGSQA